MKKPCAFPVQMLLFAITDRNPQKFVDIYHCIDTDFQKATIRIYHDQLHPGKIILPLLKHE